MAAAASSGVATKTTAAAKYCQDKLFDVVAFKYPGDRGSTTFEAEDTAGQVSNEVICSVEGNADKRLRVRLSGGGRVGVGTEKVETRVTLI